MVSSVKLAELWQRMGYRVTVVCMSKTEGVDQVSPTLTIHRRKDIFLPDPWNYGIAPGFSRYVHNLVADTSPDLIIVNKLLFWSSLALIRLRRADHKVLLLTDAFVGMTWKPRHLFPKIVMAIGAWTAGWLVLLYASRIVTFHPEPRKLLRCLGIQKKTSVIPTGIDVTRYSLTRFSLNDRTGNPPSSAAGGLRGAGEQRLPAVTLAKEGANKQQMTITYVGRLESVKGVDDFLAAAVPLKKHCPGITVQVVGWYKKDHPLVSTYAEDVRFTGLRHDIPEILKETDIFVLPSYSEGLSNALMEAMASGCACIAGDVGGNRFLIQNGISGFLFPAGDRAALRAHLERLLKDPAKIRSLGENARKRIDEQFSWKIVENQYENLFKELIMDN